MTPRQILFIVTMAIVAADIIWASVVPFDIDRGAYISIGLIAAGIGLGSLFYTHVRPDENLSAMLFGTFFLVAFSAGLSVLNYFLLTVAGPRIDQQLAAIDRMLGIDWPSLMRYAEAHPLANRLLNPIYLSLLGQVAVMVVGFGFAGRPQHIYKLCLAIAVSASLTVCLWTLAPSFGAFSVYPAPTSSAAFPLALDADYARDLVDLLARGPGHISPYELKGLIGFPSFHAALAALIAWYAWPLRFLRWPLIALNLLVIAATPIQGGHHIIDVLGGLLVAALAVMAARFLCRLGAKRSAAHAAEIAGTRDLLPERLPAA